RSTGFGLEVKSTDGVIRLVLSVTKPSQLLLPKAYGPVPPVPLPANWPAGPPPSQMYQGNPPSTLSLVIDQPGGRTPSSKPSKRPVVTSSYPGALQVRASGVRDQLTTVGFGGGPAVPRGTTRP